MKYTNIPRMVAPEAIIISSQKLSWASGQWYLRRRSRTRITVSRAMFVVGGGIGEEGREGEVFPGG